MLLLKFPLLAIKSWDAYESKWGNSQRVFLDLEWE
jgi:hypothetical protein